MYKKNKVKIINHIGNKLQKTDDPLALYGKYLGIKVERGPLEDVSERFALVLKKHKCDAFLEFVVTVHCF